jgi:hypothetical protein
MHIEVLDCSPDETFIIKTSQEKVETFLKRKLNNRRQFYSEVSQINHGVLKELYFYTNFQHFNALSWTIRGFLRYTAFILSRKPLLHNLLLWFVFISVVNLINANSSITMGSLIYLLSDLNTCYSQGQSRMQTFSYMTPSNIQYLCSFHRNLLLFTSLLL